MKINIVRQDPAIEVGSQPRQYVPRSDGSPEKRPEIKRATISFTRCEARWLGCGWTEGEQPRVLLQSVPYALKLRMPNSRGAAGIRFLVDCKAP
jgi:hypothetical protein